MTEEKKEKKYFMIEETQHGTADRRNTIYFRAKDEEDAKSRIGHYGIESDEQYVEHGEFEEDEMQTEHFDDLKEITEEEYKKWIKDAVKN